MATVYVSKNATGSNNGTSWGNAYTDLQTALNNAPFGSEIWVAQGTYTPTTTSDRAASFRLRNSLEVYGGFAGIEASREQRNLTIYPTVLSGDIGVVGDNSDNSVHVVTATDLSSTAILDGFTIQGGNANINDPANAYERGGGIYNLRSDAVFSNLTIAGNTSLLSGGGLYNELSQPRLFNVTLSNNVVSDPGNGDGGGIYNISSNPLLENVRLQNNTARDDGGAIFNQGSNPTLKNVVLVGNIANDDGGGIANTQNSTVSLNNSRLENNRAGNRGGGFFSDTGTATIINSIFSSNTAIPVGG